MAHDVPNQDQPEDVQLEQDPPAQLNDPGVLVEVDAPDVEIEAPGVEADPIELPLVVIDEELIGALEIVEGDEPESRLILETPKPPVAAPADYLPLFVAPQPVSFETFRAAKAVVEDDDDDEDEDDVDDDDESPTDSDDESSDPPANRRRRRGRRGRGRGRGEQGGDDAPEGDADDESSETNDSEDDSDDEDDDSGDDEAAGGDGASRRRRRRRRRKSGAAAESDEPTSADDPPNTVVHERAPRARAEKSPKSDEIQGISGSTRLEAKRQRRRDGRDAGRRRPPILSEAEFLARREAVNRVMVVRDKVRTEPPHEGARYTQIAVLEDGVVVEHFVTSAASASLVGNIYLGIVQNVLPSM